MGAEGQPVLSSRCSELAEESPKRTGRALRRLVEPYESATAAFDGHALLPRRAPLPPMRAPSWTDPELGGALTSRFHEGGV